MPRPFLLAFLLAPLALGCGGASDGDDRTTPPTTEPVYAVQSMIFGDQGSFTYVSLLPGLDTQPTVQLANAREFPGYAPADAWDGAVIVGSGEAPTLTRYAVGDDGTWSDTGTVSFASFTTTSLDGSVYVTPTKAYVPIDVTNHVTWDPTAVTVGTPIGAPPEIPLTRDGGAAGTLTAWRGFGHELRDGLIFQPYYWSDASFHAYSQTSQIAVIDTATDAIAAVIDAPCPHLHITSRDDAGNLYFSNGQGSIAAAILGADHAPNCVVRIKAGERTLDPTFTREFRDLTGGREGSNFFYVGNGTALINVYHAERDDLTPDTAFEDVDYSTNYHLWTLDLDTMQATQLGGLDYGGGQFTAFRIDDRTFIAIPTADYAQTAVYEILPNGRAEKRFDTEGWTFKMFRVR